MLIQIEATTAQLRRELAASDKLVARTTSSIDRNLANVDASFDRSAQAAQRAGTLMRGTFAALAGAGLVGGIIRQVDAYGQMADRLRMATSGTAEYQQVQAHLLETAQQTYRPLAEAQELYIRTADVMRSLGYNTQQTLDITDSFSFLLVTNAASADRAQSALDAYSKALQTGKVEADGWVAIQTAMPTIVNAIAAGTGKSAEEIRRLGAQGKLALDDINTGLLNTVEVNRKAAEKMSTSVQDAMVNIQNAITKFVGGAEESTGVFAGLAKVLGVVADNVGVVASVLGGAGAAALTLYSAKAVVSTVEMLKSARAAIVERNARIAQADAVLQAAIADQRKAQTATILAAREAAAARGTAVQTQMSIQLAQARAREAAATVAVTAAQNGLKVASAGALGVLGGPLGLALLAGSAAASFFLMRDGSDAAKISLDDLTMSVEEYGKKWAEASKEQRRALLVNAREQLGEVKTQLDDSITAIETAFYERGPQAGQPFGDVITQLGELRTAAENGAPIDDIVQGLLDGVPASSSFRAAIEKSAGEVATHATQQTTLNNRIAEFTDRVDESTVAIKNNNAAKTGMSSAGQTYLDTLTKQLAKLQDNGSAVAEANRYIAEHTELTEGERVAILSAAYANEAQAEANKKATAAQKDHTKSVEDEIKALDQLLDRALPERKRLNDLVEDIERLRKAQADNPKNAKLYEEAIAGLNQAYADSQIEKQAKAEQKLAEIRRNSAEAYRAAMEVILQTRQQEIDNDVTGIGLGDDQREQLQRINEIRQRYAQQRRELEQQQEDASRRLGDTAYKQRLADLAEFQAREIQMEVDGHAARLAAQQDYTNGARRAWQNIKADAADVASATEDSLTTGFNTARDAVAEFAMTGKLNFRSFAASVIADMARIQAAQAASGLLSSAIGWGISAFTGGSSSAGATQSGYTGSDFSNWLSTQAKGGAWDSGVQFFAKGGAFTNSIVSQPTAFGMAGGAGVMGEDGPEAIVPLARAADGSLGVRAVGAGNAGSNISISAPAQFVMQDRSDEGMELDQAALAANWQKEMQAAADRAIAASWRSGGISYRNAKGIA